MALNLPCLMLPVTDKNLILPSSAVAEIVPYEKPKDVTDGPEWLVGISSWRGINVPLTYLEKIDTHLAWNFLNKNTPLDLKEKPYIAVINRIEKVSNEDEADQKFTRYPFFSIMLQGIPKLYHLTEDMIKTVTQFPEGNPRFLMEIKIQGEYALIPNLHGLWSLIDALPLRLQWFRQIII